MPFYKEALRRRPAAPTGPAQSGDLRKLVVFKALSPLLFACTGISGLVCGLYLAFLQNVIFALPLFAITTFSVIRFIHWRRLDISQLPSCSKAVMFIRLSAMLIAPILAAYAVYLILISPIEIGLIAAGWMTMMACITGISLCIVPMTARATILTILLPPNITLVMSGVMTSFLYGLSMIVLSAFCIGTFSTVMRLIRSITNEAEENASQRGWIAAAMSDFLSLSKDAAWEVDERMCFTQLAQSAQRLTGREAETLIGTKFQALIDFSDRRSRESSREFARLLEARAAFQGLVFSVFHSDGRNRFIRVSGMPLFNHVNKFSGYHGLISDVTTQIENQLAMEESEQRFRDFAELAAERLWETDEDHCFTYISQAEVLNDNRDPQKLIGRKAGDILKEANTATPEDKARWEDHFATIARREPYKDFILRDNQGRVLSISGKPIFTPEGAFRGYRGYTREISSEYQARQAARDAEAKLTEANRKLEERMSRRTRELQEKTDLLQEIFDTMGESLVVLDNDLTVAMVNEKPGISLPPGTWALGDDAREIYTRSYALGLYRDRGCSQEKTFTIAEKLDRGEPLRLNRIDTSGQHISENFYPRKGGGYVVLYTDITKEAKREEELRALSVDLRRSKEAAEAASRIKSEFLANMSHEIRTPMNGILGMAEILNGTELTDQQQEMTRVITRSADSLLTIINDILDFSKLEAGKMTFVKESFDLKAAINDVAGILAPKAASKGIDLNIELDDAASHNYIGDVGRVRQVITNLVGNAVKFTEAGSVSVAVQEERSGSEAMLSVAVTDTGCGIPADKLDRIFNKFEQVDGSSSRQYEGTGLGLSISRRIAEMMGGTITVTSEVGKGSTFLLTVTLRVDQSARTDLKSLPKGTLGAALEGTMQGYDVLIAEDNLVNQMVLKAMLEPLAFTIHVAGNGQEALDMFKTNAFDIVLMDVSMPVMDGLQATREIKKIQARNGRKVPVIGITAHAMQEDQERCLKAGMDDYLPKPVRKEAVMKMIVKWMEQKKPAAKSNAA